MKIPKALAKACQVLRRRVRYKQATMRLPGNNNITKNDTAVIQEATRLYVESWVVPIINAIERGDLHFMKKYLSSDVGDLMEANKEDQDEQDQVG